jgi:hypothetical protein
MGEYTDRQQGDLISLLLFFHNKESRLDLDDGGSSENRIRTIVPSKGRLPRAQRIRGTVVQREPTGCAEALPHFSHFSTLKMQAAVSSEMLVTTILYRLLHYRENAECVFLANVGIFLAQFPYFEKNKSKLMRSACRLCVRVSVYPPTPQSTSDWLNQSL